MGKIENEFEKSTFEEWVNKIQQDLKGQPLSVLTSHPEPDLEIVAYHHEATRPQLNEHEVIRNFAKKSNDYFVIRRCIPHLPQPVRLKTPQFS